MGNCKMFFYCHPCSLLVAPINTRWTQILHHSVRLVSSKKDHLALRTSCIAPFGHGDLSPGCGWANRGVVDAWAQDGRGL